MSYSANITLAGAQPITVTQSGPVPGIPGLYVFFRPDEIEFHLGVSRDKSITPYDLGAYTATILNNGVQVASYSVPSHNWFTRWPHYINPDKVINSPADIVKARLFFPYGKFNGIMPQAPTNQYAGPMDTAGIDPNMGDTGERNDLDLLPEWSAVFMQQGISVPMFEAAKGQYSVPVWLTDESTGAPWDMIANPLETSYSLDAAQNNPAEYIGPFPAEPVQWNGAHFPQAGAMQFFASGLLRHLQALQYSATYELVWTNWFSKQTGYASLDIGQVRSVMYGGREIILALRATILAEQMYGTLPSYLLPSSYWKQIVANQLKFLTSIAFDKSIDKFRLWPFAGYASMWMNDMEMHFLALAAMYDPAWVPIYKRTLQGLVDRMDGKHGWPMRVPYVYRVSLGPKWTNDSNGNFTNFPASLIDPADEYADWPEVWKNLVIAANAGAVDNPKYAAAINAADADKSNTSAWLYDAIDTTGAMYVHQALAQAVWLDEQGIVDMSDITELKNAYAMQDKMAQVFAATLDGTNYHYIPARVSITVDALPPATQPPVGEVTMGKPVAVQVGQHVQVPFTYDDGKTPPGQCADPVAITAKGSADGLVTAVVTDNKDGTGMIDVVGVAPSPAGATLVLSALGATGAAPVTDSSPLTVTAKLPLVGAVHLNP